MIHSRSIVCFRCHKTIAVQFDAEPQGPLYCVPCEPAVQKEREQFAREAAEYRAKLHSARYD